MIAGIALLLLGTISCWECVEAAGRRYDGYKLIQTEVPTTNTQVLEDVFHKYKVDVWRHPTAARQSFDFMISPDDYESVTMELANIGANFTTVISNVQNLIDGEQEMGYTSRRRRHKRNLHRGGFYRRYHSYKEIKGWMKGFFKANRDIVRLQSVGTTYRGRKIIAIKIGVPRNTTKRIIWQDGGIHAREWITGASLLWVVKSLVKGYRENDPRIVKFLFEMDWYVLPIWNVDGYRHSWTRERLWRKSRGESGPLGCIGVDLNRNFDTKHRGYGTASDDQCSDVYHGKRAFSEVESRTVADFLFEKKRSIAAMITLHSYAQLWMHPYGYTYGSPNDYNDLNALSSRVVTAIHSVHGTQYTHGSVSDLAYKVSGSSVDWSYDKLCVKYSFAVELRDTGQYGFVLPEIDIVPTAEEYFEGVKVVADHVVDLSRNELRSSSCS